jgi:hypothetical protein
MNLIERAKAILTTPKTEWNVIDGESDDASKITMTYLIPLILIGTVASFIGFGLIGANYGFGFRFRSTELGIKLAISYAVRGVVGVYVLAFIIDALAPQFNSEKNFNKSFQLAAYSATASLVASVLLIIPSLALLIIIAAIYGLYIAYLGIPVLKKTSQDKHAVYFVVILVVSFAVNLILSFIERQLFYPKINLGSFDL